MTTALTTCLNVLIVEASDVIDAKRATHSVTHQDNAHFYCLIAVRDGKQPLTTLPPDLLRSLYYAAIEQANILDHTRGELAAEISTIAKTL